MLFLDAVFHLAAGAVDSERPFRAPVIDHCGELH
jgi:hypothetical protein